MNNSPFLFVALCIALLVILYLVARLRRVRGQLMIIEEVLDDIKNGNPNRRVLARKSDMTKRMCYLINEIAVENQSQLLKQKVQLLLIFFQFFGVRIFEIKCRYADKVLLSF